MSTEPNPESLTDNQMEQALRAQDIMVQKIYFLKTHNSSNSYKTTVVNVVFMNDNGNSIIVDVRLYQLFCLRGISATKNAIYNFIRFRSDKDFTRRVQQSLEQSNTYLAKIEQKDLPPDEKSFFEMEKRVRALLEKKRQKNVTQSQQQMKKQPPLQASRQESADQSKESSQRRDSKNQESIATATDNQCQQVQTSKSRQDQQTSSSRKNPLHKSSQNPSAMQPDTSGERRKKSGEYSRRESEMSQTFNTKHSYNEDRSVKYPRDLDKEQILVAAISWFEQNDRLNTELESFRPINLYSDSQKMINPFSSMFLQQGERLCFSKKENLLQYSDFMVAINNIAGKKWISNGIAFLQLWRLGINNDEVSLQRMVDLSKQFQSVDQIDTLLCDREGNFYKIERAYKGTKNDYLIAKRNLKYYGDTTDDDMTLLVHFYKQQKGFQHKAYHVFKRISGQWYLMTCYQDQQEVDLNVLDQGSFIFTPFDKAFGEDCYCSTYKVRMLQPHEYQVRHYVASMLIKAYSTPNVNFNQAYKIFYQHVQENFTYQQEDSFMSEAPHRRGGQSRTITKPQSLGRKEEGKTSMKSGDQSSWQNPYQLSEDEQPIEEDENLYDTHQNQEFQQWQERFEGSSLAFFTDQQKRELFEEERLKTASHSREQNYNQKYKESLQTMGSNLQVTSPQQLSTATDDFNTGSSQENISQKHNFASDDQQKKQSLKQREFEAGKEKCLGRKRTYDEYLGSQQVPFFGDDESNENRQIFGSRKSYERSNDDNQGDDQTIAILRELADKMNKKHLKMLGYWYHLDQNIKLMKKQTLKGQQMNFPKERQAAMKCHLKDKKDEEKRLRNQIKKVKAKELDKREAEKLQNQQKRVVKAQAKEAKSGQSHGDDDSNLQIDQGIQSIGASESFNPFLTEEELQLFDLKNYKLQRSKKTARDIDELSQIQRYSDDDEQVEEGEPTELEQREKMDQSQNENNNTQKEANQNVSDKSSKKNTQLSRRQETDTETSNSNEQNENQNPTSRQNSDSMNNQPQQMQDSDSEPEYHLIKDESSSENNKMEVNASSKTAVTSIPNTSTNSTTNVNTTSTNPSYRSNRPPALATPRNPAANVNNPIPDMRSPTFNPNNPRGNQPNPSKKVSGQKGSGNQNEDRKPDNKKDPSKKK